MTYSYGQKEETRVTTCDQSVTIPGTSPKNIELGVGNKSCLDEQVPKNSASFSSVKTWNKIRKSSRTQDGHQCISGHSSKVNKEIGENFLDGDFKLQKWQPISSLFV